MHNQSAPLVSIVINCYNGEQFVGRALESAFQQTFQDFEIVFYDNKSEDNSVLIASNLADSRTRVIEARAHTNLSIARNNALRECRGRLAAFLDVDDMWDPTKLSQQVDEWKRTSSEILGTNHIRLGLKTSSVAYQFLKARNRNVASVAANYYVPMSSLVFDLKFLKRNQLWFDESTHLIGDFVLVIESMLRGATLNCLLQPLTEIQVRDDSESSRGMTLLLEELNTYALKCRQPFLHACLKLRRLEILGIHKSSRQGFGGMLRSMGHSEITFVPLLRYLWIRIWFKGNNLFRRALG